MMFELAGVRTDSECEITDARPVAHGFSRLQPRLQPWVHEANQILEPASAGDRTGLSYIALTNECR